MLVGKGVSIWTSTFQKSATSLSLDLEGWSWEIQCHEAVPMC